MQVIGTTGRDLLIPTPTCAQAPVHQVITGAPAEDHDGYPNGAAKQAEREALVEVAVQQ